MDTLYQDEYIALIGRVQDNETISYDEVITMVQHDRPDLVRVMSKYRPDDLDQYLMTNNLALIKLAIAKQRYRIFMILYQTRAMSDYIHRKGLDTNMYSVYRCLQENSLG